VRIPTLDPSKMRSSHPLRVQSIAVAALIIHALLLHTCLAATGDSKYWDRIIGPFEHANSLEEKDRDRAFMQARRTLHDYVSQLAAKELLEAGRQIAAGLERQNGGKMPGTFADLYWFWPHYLGKAEPGGMLDSLFAEVRDSRHAFTWRCYVAVNLTGEWPPSVPFARRLEVVERLSLLMQDGTQPVELRKWIPLRLADRLSVVHRQLARNLPAQPEGAESSFRRALDNYMTTCLRLVKARDLPGPLGHSVLDGLLRCHIDGLPGHEKAEHALRDILLHSEKYSEKLWPKAARIAGSGHIRVPDLKATLKRMLDVSSQDTTRSCLRAILSELSPRSPDEQAPIRDLFTPPEPPVVEDRPAQPDDSGEPPERLDIDYDISTIPKGAPWPDARAKSVEPRPGADGKPRNALAGGLSPSAWIAVGCAATMAAAGALLMLHRRRRRRRTR